MKYSLLLLIAYGFVAFTFAAPAEVNEEEAPAQKVIKEDLGM